MSSIGGSMFGMREKYYIRLDIDSVLLRVNKFSIRNEVDLEIDIIFELNVGLNINKWV